MTTIELNTSAPPTPEYVLEVGEAMAECARVLNHLAGHPGALKYPSDADRLIRSLSTAAARFPQLLTQITAWVNTQYVEGRIGMASGAEHDSPMIATMAVEVRLAEAAQAAELLQQALDAAASVTSAMAGTGDDGSEERD